MTTSVSSCATPPPLPLSGGGPAQSPVQQSPIQAPVQAGGAAAAPAQSPMQAPTQPSAVQGAAGGGELVQPAATQPQTAPPAAPAAPAAAPATTQAPADVTAGGPVDVAQLVPVLTQLTEVLTSLVSALQSQAQTGAAAVQGGGSTATAASECGMPDCDMGVAQAAAGANAAPDAPSESRSDEDTAPSVAAADQSGATAKGAGALDGALKVKGQKMTSEQRKLAEIVLQTGVKMGAGRKVLETAVSTMIQESSIKNDASVDSKDHDSLGLFQQRPSQGWGTRKQISDPEHAAKKFFEGAIANDKKNPGLAKTKLAQSVQRSAFPDAYAQWDKEAEKIVADFLG